MRNFVLLFLGLSLLACKSEIQKNEAAIQELANNWQTATNAVTELQNGLSGDMNAISTTAQTYILSEEAIGALKGDAATQYNEAISTYRNATNVAYTPVLNEINSFVSEWSTKTGDLTALTEGLKSGKYEGNVLDTITTLTEFATTGNEFATVMSEKRNELKAGADAAIEKLKMAFEATTPKK